MPTKTALAFIRVDLSARSYSITGRSLLSMQRTAVPFVVGVSYKPGLGHALVIGRGGTAVEELKDYATLLLPAGRAKIEDALAGLKISGKLMLADKSVLLG